MLTHVMGCGASSAKSSRPYPKQAYPGQGGHRQGYQNYNNRGRAPTSRVMGPSDSGNSQADALLVGAAIGYGIGGYHGGMIDTGIPMMGQELPMGYHVGPTMPEHNVEVMGVDVF